MIHLKVSNRYGFLLLILWLFQSCFPVIFYSLERYQLQQLQNCRSSERVVTILHLALRQPIAWEKEGKEFYYNGKLFDVKKITCTQTEKIITCVADEEETRIVETHYKNNDPSHTPLNSRYKVKSFFDLKYLNEIVSFINPMSTGKHEFIDRAGVTIVPTCREVITPPPEHSRS